MDGAERWPLNDADFVPHPGLAGRNLLCPLMSIHPGEVSMKNVRTGCVVLAALGFILSPACGDTTGNDPGASKGDNGVGGSDTGLEAGVSIGGDQAVPAPTTGGVSPSVGGYPQQTGGWLGVTGGAPVGWGGYPVQAGGWWMGTGGYYMEQTGGSYSEAPPNGATCLCRLAESVRVPNSWMTATCSSDDPNICSLEKAYCGQTCAGDATCGESCISTFSGHAFSDAATYTYGSCNLIIRCPAPSTSSGGAGSTGGSGPARTCNCSCYCGSCSGSTTTGPTTKSCAAGDSSCVDCVAPCREFCTAISCSLVTLANGACS